MYRIPKVCLEKTSHTGCLLPSQARTAANLRQCLSEGRPSVRRKAPDVGVRARRNGLPRWMSGRSPFHRRCCRRPSDQPVADASDPELFLRNHFYFCFFGRHGTGPPRDGFLFAGYINPSGSINSARRAVRAVWGVSETPPSGSSPPLLVSRPVGCTARSLVRSDGRLSGSRGP